MGKFISLGEYNKLYKYIWIYLAFKFISIFVYDYGLIFDQFQNDPLEIKNSPFISISFLYITFIIISLILKKFKNYFQKEQHIQDLIDEDKLIFNKKDITELYGLVQGDYFLYINLFIVVVTDLLEEIIYKLKCSILEYWMFEILFFEIFNSKLLNTKIYKHHICSLIFILFSCSLIKTIVITLSFINNTEDVEIFHNRKWLISLGIVVYFIFQVVRAFTYCNENYYLQKKIISITDYIFLYGIFGIIASSFCAVLSTFIPCGDNSIPELSKIVCEYKDDNGTYYFDSYSLYLKDLASNYLGLRIILLIIQSILFYGRHYYIYVIYQKLSPIYHICMKILVDLVIGILLFINDLVNNHKENIHLSISILNILIFIFYIFGSIVYLEFIELNFCDLNFYTRRRIKGRADKEFKISDDYNVNSVIDEDNDDEDEESNEIK